MFHFYQARIQPGSASVCAHAGARFFVAFRPFGRFCHALFLTAKGLRQWFSGGQGFQNGNNSLQFVSSKMKSFG